jgi:hypothetical protein
MKNKKLSSLLLLIPLVLLVFLGATKNTMLVFATGTADAYGDEISEVSVWQSTTMKGNITHANYTSGVEIKVDALTATRFNVSVLLNDTFATTEAEAITNTRIYINITYTNGTTIISTTEITDYYSEDLGNGFYIVKSYYLWNDATHHPIAGITYYVWFKYEIYR